MNDILTGSIARGQAVALQRGEVMETDGADLRVRLLDAPEQTLVCDVLASGAEATPRYAPGEPVLVWLPSPAARGVVLGRIAAASTEVTEAPPAPLSAAGERPDELVIEARRSLTLKVGDGSITIRKDGRILIKGRDLVSHAKRTNRIRGGAVSIN
jgi:hypothetical protein